MNMEAKLYELCGGIIVIFVFFIAIIALQIIECILDIIIAPRFGLKILTASVFGFLFIRDNGQWKISFHRLSPVCKCQIGYGLNTPIPENSFEREKQATYLIRALVVLISLLMVFFFWNGNDSLGLSYGEWELLWNLLMVRNWFVAGMLVFSVVNMGLCIYIFQISAKRMCGYVDRAIQKLRQGYSFEELNLKPMEELAFKKVTDAEKLCYYYVYVYYLLAASQMEELDKVSEEITRLLETSIYEIHYTGLYYWLVYYYSKYYVDSHRADQFLKMAWPVLSKDSDANAKRVLAQYYYGIRGDVNKAREYLMEGLACVEKFSVGTEREMERRLLEELAEELGYYNSDSQNAGI